jgi:hypothetical protein
LNECVQNHSQCRLRTFDLAALPSRLLDVGQGRDGVTVRVQDTTAIGVSVQYLALSHCWGNLHTIKLTSMSLAQHYASSPIQELPKTFREAVSITRKLGFRYLWIDSLCIIQDSDEDWKHESAKMGDIYRNSTCCIAALAARDSNGGCFSSRDPTTNFPCRLGISGVENLFVVAEPDNNQYDYSSGYFDRAGQPLWGRAWVFQETALARRTLNYDARMIYWECLQIRAWESMPDWQTEAKFESVKHPIGKIQMLGERANAEPESEFARELRIEWGKIVHSYAACNLTRATDKLIALSGLTSRVQLYTGWRYLAGLWETNLRQHLFWYIQSQSPTTRKWVPGTRPSVYRAPTWSWASIEGSVSWYHPTIDYKWLTKVIAVHVDLVDPAYPFSEISGGAL